MTASTILLPPAGPRVTEPICPVWCVGHNATYQSWEDVDDKWIRYHGGVDRLVHSVAIECMAIEDASGNLSPATVSVYVDNGGADADLTPAQTMAVAKRLLDAAEAVALHNEARR